MWITRREYEALEKQVDYWRRQFEQERARADKLTDTILQTNGLPPVAATPALSGGDHQRALTTKDTGVFAELYQMEIKDRLEEDGSVDESAVPTATH